MFTARLLKEGEDRAHTSAQPTMEPTRELGKEAEPRVLL